MIFLISLKCPNGTNVSSLVGIMFSALLSVVPILTLGCSTISCLTSGTETKVEALGIL